MIDNGYYDPQQIEADPVAIDARLANDPSLKAMRGLPAERDLAREAGISRMTARQALADPQPLGARRDGGAENERVGAGAGVGELVGPVAPHVRLHDGSGELGDLVDDRLDGGRGRALG